uniref:WLM domain-containing protein n=1 Tax=Phaeomonas parva TaxID=124430 RepID=A0A7S1XMW3_9STRA|mmetsp:Transcript_18447/g.56373  ORF Transcript_18447/g.56373 Transcript_18447/m.56373 type:complete len:497 (+) Transcript_18447:139-1629(+)
MAPKRVWLPSKKADAAPLFGTIRVLQRGYNAADRAAALALLTRAAEEVQPVMARRGWRVPVLEEFLPKSPNLLGLNYNSGAKIRVRLRRNRGGGGFFEYNHVLGTLLHELVHNQIGPHNKSFFALLDTLWTEVENGGPSPGVAGSGAAATLAHVPFLGRGDRVGGDHGRPRSEEELRQLRSEAAAKRARLGRLAAGSGRRLGGAASGGAKDADSLRRRVREAAERRRQADTICGGAKGDEVIEVLDDADEEEYEVVELDTEEQQRQEEEEQGKGRKGKCKQEDGEEGGDGAKLPPAPQQRPREPTQRPRPGAFGDMICCQACAAAAAAGESAGTSPDTVAAATTAGILPGYHESGVNHEVAFLAELLRGDAPLASLHVLRRVVRNLRRYPRDMKYRRLNLLTDTGAQLLGDAGTAINFLNLLGFDSDGAHRLVAPPPQDIAGEGSFLDAAAAAVDCAIRTRERGSRPPPVDSPAGAAGALKPQGGVPAAQDVIDLT